MKTLIILAVAFLCASAFSMEIPTRPRDGNAFAVSVRAKMRGKKNSELASVLDREFYEGQIAMIYPPENAEIKELDFSGQKIYRHKWAFNAGKIGDEIGTVEIIFYSLRRDIPESGARARLAAYHIKSNAHALVGGFKFTIFDMEYFSMVLRGGAL